MALKCMLSLLLNLKMIVQLFLSLQLFMNIDIGLIEAISKFSNYNYTRCKNMFQM